MSVVISSSSVWPAEDEIDNPFGRPDAELCARGDEPGEFVGVLLEIVGGNQFVDETEPKCIVCVDMLTGEQNPLRPRGPDDVDETLGRLQAVDQAELGRRDAEAGAFVGESQIARERDAAPPPMQ